jgi:general secretion pathway protein G
MTISSVQAGGRGPLQRRVGPSLGRAGSTDSAGLPRVGVTGSGCAKGDAGEPGELGTLGELGEPVALVALVAPGESSESGKTGKALDAPTGAAAVVAVVAAVALPGSGSVRTARGGPCRVAASMTWRCCTLCSMKPGATWAPTEKTRGDWPSTAISATPWPLARTITPSTRKRSAPVDAAPASAVAFAPSTRAMSFALPARTCIGAEGEAGFGVTEVRGVTGATAAAGRDADRAAWVQYQADSRLAASRAAVTRRRAEAFCKEIMGCPSSPQDAPACKRGRPHQHGFTLIELMVVLVIMGVLAALIVPNVLDRADDARISAARTDVNNLMQALKLYRLDNQRYPTAEQGLQALVQRPDKSPVPSQWKAYVDKLPSDPWGQPYVYLNPGLKGEIDVLSYGADGQPGGDGKNADVGSWQ